MNDGILVVKFGGTSMGSSQAIHEALDIVRRTTQDWPRQVVVLSAMSGVTDRLLQSAQSAEKGDLGTYESAAAELRQRHLDVLRSLVGTEGVFGTEPEIDRLIAEFQSICHAIAVLHEATPRALDAIAAFGERFVVRVFAAALSERGQSTRYIDGTELILTDETFQNAHPDIPGSRSHARPVLLPLLDSGVIPIVTGFLGATQNGVTTTLGRGGSDYSASILGAILDAEEVWIWTDVNGVMTADPRLIPEAVTVPQLSYLEMSELAYFGAKVLHPKSVRPVVEAGIGLRICNTFQPDHPGTRIISEKTRDSDGTIRAVTAIRNQGLVTIEGRGMLGVPGVAARAFGAVAATGTSVILITQASSEQSICFAVPSDSTRKVIASIEDAFKPELSRRDIDRVWVMEPMVIVTLVGSGLRETSGIAGRIFSALGDAGVNVVAIAQGSSEVAISIVVRDEDTERAVKALHELILIEANQSR
jgi:aspartate kinase